MQEYEKGENIVCCPGRSGTRAFLKPVTGTYQLFIHFCINKGRQAPPADYLLSYNCEHPVNLCGIELLENRLIIRVDLVADRGSPGICQCNVP